MNTMTKMMTACVVAALAACAVPANDGNAPASVDENVGEEASVTWNGYTGTALTPTSSIQNAIRGGATFTGPATATKMGVCLLQMTTTPCTGADAIVTGGYGGPCVAAITLPAGGNRYCTAPNGGAQKYCAFRPGSQTSYCAGSPANGGVAVAPGTYYTPYQGIPMGTTSYVSYACFIGCNGTDPSVSSAALVSSVCTTAVPPGCNASQCFDKGCDGTRDYCQSNTGAKIFC